MTLERGKKEGEASRLSHFGNREAAGGRHLSRVKKKKERSGGCCTTKVRKQRRGKPVLLEVVTAKWDAETRGTSWATSKGGGKEAQPRIFQVPGGDRWGGRGCSSHRDGREEVFGDQVRTTDKVVKGRGEGDSQTAADWY